MKCGRIFILVFFSLCIVSSYALEDEIHVINSGFGDLQYDTLNALHFASEQERVSVVKRDIPSHTATRVRRQVLVAGGGTRVEDLTAKQDCDGILLQWNGLTLPFNPEKPTANGEFKHFNVYRSTMYFNDVSGMRPYVSGERDMSLQNPGKDSFKDLYPPVNTELYYAVTIVDGEGQEEKAVEAKKIVFVGAMQKSGPLFKIVPGFLSRVGKVLHHSTAWNSKRNEYLVAFDFDVNNDDLPDQLFALRLDTRGLIVDKRMLNFTANLNKKAGNQGWPTVAYNNMADEYMIAFQFRSGVAQYFNNKYIIISQRVMSSQTERAAGPSLLVKANGQGGKNWIDATNPVIKFNSVTGGYVGAVVVEESRKEVASLFVDSKGKVLKAETICSFKGSAFEPNIFFDSKRNEFFFACTVESGGVANADFNLRSDVHSVVLTKRDGNGQHASNTETSKTKNFVGYTNNTFAKTTGYYNELTDRLVLFWEDNNEGKPFISTASVLLTRRRYVRKVQAYSCLTTRRVRTPLAVYFPINGNHFMVWQEQGRGSWVIGGELLQGNMQLAFGRRQQNPVTLYNSKIQGAFVTWHEAGVLLARQVLPARRPLCSPPCTFQQTCAVQDKCVSNTGDSCTINKGGCSHVCTSLGHWKVRCSCPVNMQLMGDGKTCQSDPTCHGMTPLKNPATGKDYFCGRGARKNVCPARSYCHISPVDAFAKCCPAPLPSYSVLVAATSSIWQLFMDTKQNRAIFQKLQIDNPEMIVALDYNPVDKRVYWSDTTANAIKRMSLSGVGGVDTLVWKDVGVVDGLTLDVEDDFLYWTDITYKNIQRAALNGRTRRTILQGLDKPRAIVLYKARRLMYWTDWGATPKIERSDLGGGSRRIIVQGDLKWPNGLVIDQESQKLFWADAGLDKIETSDLLGNGRRVLLGAPHVNHPYSLAILKNSLFWSDWETGGIHSVDKETGKDVKTVAQGLDRPTGFAVFKATPPVDSSVRCPDPGDPINGDRHPSPEEDDDFPQGTVIRYTCFPQYDLHGPVTRTCLGDGSWSDKAPQCLTPPRFREIPSNVTIDETLSTILTCSASSPDTKITWYKDGKIVTGDNFGFLASGNLLILRAFLEDKGWYVCNATNKAGTKLARAYLKVVRPLDADCGRTQLTTRGKIIGGTKVEAGTYPWMASLLNNRTKKHFCGGSLVSKQWVVTAAHCFPSDISVGDIVVRLGKLFTDTKLIRKEKNQAQIFRAKRIIIHPQYSTDPIDYDSDLALIELSSEAHFTDYVRPICLPLRKSDADETLLKTGNDGVIIGWGRKEVLGRAILKRMHQATVPIVSQALCKKAHHRYLVTSNMFCAGQHSGTINDACKGDSGGPLAINNIPEGSSKTERWVLAGVISWGDGCGQVGKYGVYTRVSVFARWITNQIS